MGRKFNIAAAVVVTVGLGLTLFILLNRNNFNNEMDKFRNSVSGKKILDSARKQCDKSPDYNKCLNDEITKVVEQHASRLHAKFKKLCKLGRSTLKYPHCIRKGLRQIAWDSKDLILKLIAIDVIGRLKDPPKELKDDAVKYYGDAMKIWSKERRVLITPICPCNTKSPSK